MSDEQQAGLVETILNRLRTESKIKWSCDEFFGKTEYKAVLEECTVTIYPASGEVRLGKMLMERAKPARIEVVDNEGVVRANPNLDASQEQAAIDVARQGLQKGLAGLGFN